MKIKILLHIFYILAIILGKYIAETPSGINFFLYAVWLAFSSIIAVLVYCLYKKIDQNTGTEKKDQ